VAYSSQQSDGLRAGRPGFISRQGQDVFRLPVGPTQRPNTEGTRSSV